MICDLLVKGNGISIVKVVAPFSIAIRSFSRLGCSEWKRRCIMRTTNVGGDIKSTDMIGDTQGK
jgi:hypothetical protein